MTGLGDGSWLSFPKAWFSSAQDVCTLRVASASGGHLEIRTGSINGPLLADITVNATGGMNTYSTQTASINPLSDLKDIILLVKGAGTGVMNLDWFSFGGGTTGVRSKSALALIRSGSAAARHFYSIDGR
jgi:hypothetical protein